MKKHLLFILVLLTGYISYAQNTEAIEDVSLKKFIDISNKMAISFPEDKMKTFRRISFSEEQLQTYLSQHITRMELLPKIKGNYQLVMSSYFHSGNWYSEVGFPQKSIEAYNDFFKYYRANKDKLTSEEMKDMKEPLAYAHSNIAENFAKQGDFKMANKAHLRNIAFAKSLGDISYPSALNNYGLYFYINKKQVDSAFQYFQKAYSVTKSNFPNHILIGSIRDNIADIYIDQGNYEKAEPLYEANFQFYKTTINKTTQEIDVPRLLSAGTQLTTTLVTLNEVEKANEVFDDVSLIMKDNKALLEISPILQLEYLIANAELLKKQNNFKGAFNIVNKVLNLSDSLHTIYEKNNINWSNELNNIILNNVAHKFELERIQKENQSAAERQKFWIAGSILIVALTILTSLFFRRRQFLVLARNKQLLAEQQLENTTLRVEQLNSDILFKERDLSDFAISLTQNRKWAKELESKLKDIRGATPQKTDSLLKELEQDLQQKITLDDSSHEFLERLDELSTAFYAKLNDQFPDLTKTEIRLCSLLRLKIDSGSIAAIQNITLASIHTSRYRLRKKLNLQGDDDLDAFIQNI